MDIGECRLHLRDLRREGSGDLRQFHVHVIELPLELQCVVFELGDPHFRLECLSLIAARGEARHRRRDEEQTDSRSVHGLPSEDRELSRA
jgi:hypothetical protein